LRARCLSNLGDKKQLLVLQNTAFNYEYVLLKKRFSGCPKKQLNGVL
jgi:hypothetical protein